MKRYRKADRARFVRDVTAIIRDLGGTPSDVYEWQLDTVCGALRLHVSAAMDNRSMGCLFTRFDNSEVAEKVVGCSRVGKWNFHPSGEVTDAICEIGGSLEFVTGRRIDRSKYMRAA